MNLSDVADARTAADTRVSWPAIFLKACAAVARQTPELRQTWYRWPWAHLYQHPDSVGVLTVQREYNGQRWLFWGHVFQPDDQCLTDIQSSLDRFRDAPVEQVFGRQLQLARLPTPLRRLIWWWNLNIATRRRAKRLGTLFLSTLAGRGAEIQLPPAIHTGCLTFGPLDPEGVSRVTLAYDHRVMDGALAAEILTRIEQTLHNQLTDELRLLRIHPLRTPAA